MCLKHADLVIITSKKVLFSHQAAEEYVMNHYEGENEFIITCFSFYDCNFAHSLSVATNVLCHNP